MPELQLPLRLIRPDDLLVLDIDVDNLRLSDDGRRLERTNPGAPARLTIHLPSQHVSEQAFLEFEGRRQPALPPPIPALAAGPSRLVFTLPDDQASLAFSVDALLDWAALIPQLAPNALPAGTLQGPAPAVPAPDQTAIEFPYLLLLSPDAGGRWSHRRTVFSPGGRAELWHTRLAGERRPVPVRAIARRPPPNSIAIPSLSDWDLNDLVTLTSDFTAGPATVPLDAEQLILTSLGASVRLRGRWDWPTLHSDKPTPTLEQYEHIAGLGRDQFVRVVRRGFVHTGHRASIVKITERQFEPRVLRTDQTQQGPVAVFGATAYLRQYYQVVIQQPLLSYAGMEGVYDHVGREMPLRTLRFTTLVTPKIDLWQPGLNGPTLLDPAAVEHDARAQHPGDERAIALAVRNAIEAALMQPFWVTAGGLDFDFGFLATDWEDNPIAAGTPLVFVPREVVGNVPGLINVFQLGPDSRRQRPIGNQRIALADSSHLARGSTQLPTERMTFTLETVTPGRRGSAPQYEPGWVFAVGAADVHVEPVERLTGSANPSSIEFAAGYLNSGMDPAVNPAGTFANILAPVSVKFAGASGGGIARPDASVDRIAARVGAIPHIFESGAVSMADLKNIFGQARLFGSINLGVVLAGIDALTPEYFSAADLANAALDQLLQDPLQHIPVPILRTRDLQLDGGARAVEARYLWKPFLFLADDFFDFTRDSELVLDARTVTPLDGAQATSQVSGELRRFGMSFFNVVKVRFERLAFVARPGAKPDITAVGMSVEFMGALEFVNTLRNILPANGFSDPPAIEVTPAGIKAGYSLAVPTVAVGMFSLQNLALSAVLSVPFTGQPAGLRFAISERHHPFLVTVTLFGGGGFFQLGVSANGVDEIEAAIEFGGNVALNLGVASGGVYVMAGIYFGLKGNDSDLTGYLRCGGYLSVLGLVTVCVEFYLHLKFHKKRSGSEVLGQATLTVCVKVVCFSKSVNLSVERRFAGAGADPTLEQVMSDIEWEHYCIAFAPEAA